METVVERLAAFPPITTEFNLANWELTDEDLERIAGYLSNFQNIKTVNISDNKFSFSGVTLFLRSLKQFETIQEINISNNWLLESRLAVFQETMIDYHIETLRMCNIQLNENNIFCMCGLKLSKIKNLYLNDNSIGNKGLQFILTTLLHNQTLQSLHLPNNNISDSGIQFLYDFLQTNSSIKYLDLQDNHFFQALSVDLLTTLNTTHRIDFTMPELQSEPSGSSIDELVINKSYKDACVVFQMLRLILHMQNIQVPLDIPRELLFSTSLESHQRIIDRLMEQPSLLAQRVHLVIEYIYHLDSISNNPVLGLIINNLPLLCKYLQSSPIQTMRISPTAEESGAVIEVPPVITTTVGTIQRSGIVKLKIIQLIECVVDKLSLSLIHPIIMCKMHSILLSLFRIHPWNSILHETVTSYFETVFSSHNPSLFFDVFANTGLVHFIMKELSSSQKRKAGYYGYLVRIAIAIQQLVEMKSNLFLSLYRCEDEECLSLFSHPLSQDSWCDFYSVFVSKHLDMCLVEMPLDSDE